MPNTKKDFYGWVKLAYPGIWPKNLDDVDWTTPYHKAMVDRWKQLGFPAGTVDQAPIDEPFSPPIDQTGERDLRWFVPGQITIDTKTGKYYDALGDLEIPGSDAQILRQQYDRGIAAPPVDWREAASAAERADRRREFDIQQAQRQAEIDWTKLRDVEATKQASYNANLWNVQQRLEGRSGREAELQRQVNELQFERDRRAMLSGVPGNDWITRYTLQNQPNPYKPQEVSPIDQLEQNLDRMTGEIQRYENEMVIAMNDLAKAQETGDARIIGEASDRWGNANKVVTDLNERRDKLEGTWKTVQDESRGWSPQPVPQPFPNAPAWLPQFAPGLEAGKMITKQNVPTPSGQQLTAMSRDQLEQLGFFGKFTGQLGGKYPWEALTEQAALMQPRTPAAAGRTRWTPSGVV